MASMNTRDTHRIKMILAASAVLGLVGLSCLPLSGEPTSSEKATKPETLRIATYNIEHFNEMFDQGLVSRDKRDWDEFFRDQEDLYEVARVINEQFDADILTVQECCQQNHLEYFNRKWLKNRYKTVKVFKGNSSRGQYLGILAKKGYELLEVREFHNEPDPVDDPVVARMKKGSPMEEGNLLFSRGPGFAKFRTPGGRVIWVGVTHVKSRYGDKQAVTQWRVRETTRTRELCGELLAEGETNYLVMTGDFNDDIGQSTEHEKALEIDAAGAMTAGTGRDKLVNLTARLDPKVGTYHAQLKTQFEPTVFDLIFASPALADAVRSVQAVSTPLAAVASDHYPVVAEFRFPAGP